jgi:hypothetical protein
MSKTITQKKSEKQKDFDQQSPQLKEVEVVEGEVINNKSHDEAQLKDEVRQDHSQIDETSTKYQIEERNQEIEDPEHTLSVQNSGTSLSLEGDVISKQDKETYLLSLKDDK